MRHEVTLARVVDDVDVGREHAVEHEGARVGGLDRRRPVERVTAQRHQEAPVHGVALVVEREPAGAHGAAAGSGSRSALASAGSPRSGKGTVISSKSRGTSVFGNTARASSRTSRGK